jgi:hypothetical protein
MYMYIYSSITGRLTVREKYLQVVNSALVPRSNKQFRKEKGQREGESVNKRTH